MNNVNKILSIAFLTKTKIYVSILKKNYKNIIV